MKIEEVIKIYEFLAISGVYGAIAAWFIVCLATLFLVLLGKEKLKLETLKHLLIAVIVILVLIGVGFYMLRIEAKERLGVLKLANCVKSAFIVNGYKVASRETIKKDFNCRCQDAVVKDENLTQIVDSYPYEFVSVETDDGERGLRIIDGPAVSAIDTYNKNHVPFVKSQILDFMLHHRKDSMNYYDIRQHVNPDFDDEWIELTISTYDNLFVPYYTGKKDSLYGVTHGIKLTRGASSLAKNK
ncbi:MAG TPA: hypothetical protein VIU12_33380 [Chryseolinea sp.]